MADNATDEPRCEDCYAKWDNEGEALREALRPLTELKTRERAIFMEYHYFKTPVKELAKAYKVSDGRIYEILNRAEEKALSARDQEPDRY